MHPHHWKPIIKIGCEPSNAYFWCETPEWGETSGYRFWDSPYDPNITYQFVTIDLNNLWLLCQRSWNDCFQMLWICLPLLQPSLCLFLWIKWIKATCHMSKINYTIKYRPQITKSENGHFCTIQFIVPNNSKPFSATAAKQIIFLGNV